MPINLTSVVNLASPEVHVAAPIVNLEATLAQPTEMTMRILSMPDRETTSEITRDSSGNINGSVQIETDR